VRKNESTQPKKRGITKNAPFAGRIESEFETVSVFGVAPYLLVGCGQALGEAPYHLALSIRFFSYVFYIIEMSIFVKSLVQIPLAP
jgi:hypothetical protein